MPAGDNASFDFSGPGRTFWFAPGTHTLGDGVYSQIIPADQQTYIGAPGAILEGRNLNFYAFTQHAVGVTIKHLTIQNFGTGTSNNNEGVVNHDAGDAWTVTNNTIAANDGAGVFVGDGNVVRENCLQGNGQYGFSAYEVDGVRSVVIDRNEITGNNTDDWERRQPGCGCTGGGKFWDVTGARVTSNWVHDNASVGLWADTNDADFLIQANWIEGNDAEGILYETSFNATITGNVLKRNALVKGRAFAGQGDNFPVAAIYLSESGGSEAHPWSTSGSGPTIEVSSNLLEDNWSAITLWENADRFCGSPANTSGGYCTGVGQASLDTCVSGTIDTEPYYTDCRWRTRNVQVHENEFRLTSANIGCASAHCAKVAILSNWGTFPGWSPYAAERVQRAITFEQGNVFASNRYVGPWVFVAFDMSGVRTWDEWRDAPFAQDARSTLS